MQKTRVGARVSIRVPARPDVNAIKYDFTDGFPLVRDVSRVPPGN